MTTNAPLSHHYYHITRKFRSQSSDSIKNPFEQKHMKMKKSQTVLEDFDREQTQNILPLRRRFSLFRLKRFQQSNENIQLQELQQTIEQLKSELQIKTNELEQMKGQQATDTSIEQAMKTQTVLNNKLEELLQENDLLKKSIEELEIFARQQRTPNSPASNSLLTTTFPEASNSIIKSTNFTSSRSEIRHKSEIEIELQQQQQQQQQQSKKSLSISPYPPILRPTNSNKRVPTLIFDENTFPARYQTSKRRFPTNSIQTQTPSLLFNQHEHQIKSLTDETIAKNEKIQVLIHELTECQAIIKQQEQQLMNGKKDRDQLYFIVDERTNDLRNLKQKNEQLEQMIRNEQEHSNSEKKLLSLLQEAQQERDDLLNKQRQTFDHLQKLEEQIKIYENETIQMRDEISSSKAQLTEMKKYSQTLELQIEYEQKQLDEYMKYKMMNEQELDQIRLQRSEQEKTIYSLDQALKMSQKQYQFLQQTQRINDDKHQQQIDEFHQHIRQLEIKIEEILKDKDLVTLRCGELIEENRRLEKALIDKEDDYEEKIHVYKEKNTLLTVQIDEIEKKLNETKKQLELVTIEKDETLADMLIAVRVASELRYDAEDRLNKANDDLKRVTEHIEQERTGVQRRQATRNTNGYSDTDIGQIKIKEMIRTLEANSRHNSLDSTIRQRPLSQPCIRTETNLILTTNHQRQFGMTIDDAKILTSTKIDTPSLNSSTHRNDSSIRSITSEQYDEMKSIVEAVCTRMPGSVCKRDALLKWCVERLANYEISITNFSNSWTDGIAFCALLHSYLPDRINFEMIKKESKKKRFEVAFNVASSVGIVSILDIDEMCSSEWPDWERVMYYVALIFRHFEGTTSNETISPILPIPQATSSPISPTLSSSSSLCASLRSSNSIPTILCSPLQTV